MKMRSIDEVKINGESLKDILYEHLKWINGEKGGMRANLSYTNLNHVDFNGCNLKYINLAHANLKGANLDECNLSFADLDHADLSGATLYFSNLVRASLINANLSGADLINTDLRNSNLRASNLTNVKTDLNTLGYYPVCPEKGSFIGYKKAGVRYEYLVELLILEDSKRSSATSFKCRCDKAKVLSIINIETKEEVSTCQSNYDSDFIYTVGEVVSVNNFDDIRWNECSTGIHFFISKECALNY